MRAGKGAGEGRMQVEHGAGDRLEGLQSVEAPTEGSFRVIAENLLREEKTAPAEHPNRPATDPGPGGKPAGPRAGSFPTHLDRDGLLQAYYMALLEEENGDLRRVAERAGRKLRHLRAEFARLGVPDDRWLRQAKQAPTRPLSQQAKHTP